MSIRHLIVIVSVISFFSSCVPTKRLMYLQEDGGETDSIIKVERIQKPYRIQVNDLLSIRVKAIDQDVVGMFNPIGEQNLNATGEERLYYDGFLVDAHGNIRVPTLGEVNVLGFTVEEVREKIEKALLEQYFKEEANIFVTVKLAGIRYTTIGEIGSGSQVIYKEQVTIMEAIANAGDIGEFGDRTDVVIVRQYPGGEKRHHIDLTTIDAMRSPYYYIQPNDLIIVNPLPQKAWGLGTTGLSNFQTFTTVLAFLTSAILLITR
ncbi:polysaccharide biosynthesis/export family protein [Salinimicrobium sediminilitoris]|uniref:polysaccharide biosynthesis/export family protein n=1 Tax=Salinimicrobium sediminilitoris TaxID=2876715 RepID=UPI001E469AFD|nr:polysaccharide biosynthesis/export family protein [Salinimicrobium sediminilitoris]MCC8358505.1 polysaccharide biosynthesis/export family protein [Salinimicrobium sediminilitoris]